MQRNRIDAELSHIRRRDTTVRCRLADNSAYEQELRRHKLGLSPSVDEVKSDAVWRLLLDAAAKEPARQQALRDLVEEVDGREEWTKVRSARSPHELRPSPPSELPLTSA